MNFTEVVTAAAITVSVAGISYVALNPERLTARAEAVAERADCRAVDQAIGAYVSVHGEQPRTVADLKRYVRGDITAYRLVGGVVTGPGCS